MTRPRLLLLGLLLAACAQLQPPSDLPPVTRVVSLETTTPAAVSLSPTSRAPQSSSPSATVTPPALTTLVAQAPTPGPTLSPVVHLMAVGDIMLAGTISDTLLAQGPQSVFADVAFVFETADLLVGNLECAISNRGEPEPKRYTFRAPPLAADALLPFDVLGLANNHSLDYGPNALADTRQLLTERNIAAVGVGDNEPEARSPVIVERNGLRLAFLAYVDVPVETLTQFDTRSWLATDSTPGVAWADLDHLTADVQAARAKADLVIVLMHFGWESHAVIRAQRLAAHAAIDAGAALVLGSHPHVLQNVEEYHGGLIAYSLGNFVFDNFSFPENYSVIFTATLTSAGVDEYNWVPVVVENGLPRLATPEEAVEVLKRVQPLP